MPDNRYIPVHVDSSPTAFSPRRPAGIDPIKVVAIVSSLMAGERRAAQGCKRSQGVL
jgi:hypothetical protein